MEPEGVRRYRFSSDYSSGRGVWTAGQEIDVTPAEADWFNRDVPGCLVEVDVKAEQKAAEAEIAAKALAKAEADAKRAAEKPPADRMVKAAGEKRDEGVMTRETNPSVVDKEHKKGTS